MRLLRILVAACLVMCALAAVGDARQSRASDAPKDPVESYEAFAKLSADERLRRWNRTTPERRFQLAQAHAWLRANQHRLSKAEVEDVKALVALLTPAHYAAPATEVAKARSAEIDRKLFCILWKSDILQAFRPVGRAEADVSWLDDMFSWVGKCYLGA